MRIVLMLILTIGLCSCKNQESTSSSQNAIDIPNVIDIKTEFDSLSTFIRKYDEPSQKFRVPSNKKTKVSGKRGTIIHIDPVSLTTEDGQPLGRDIDVELKELLNKEDFLKANTQTISDGRLLISGGAYYINMTSEGRQLKLREGRGIVVEFPKLTESEMSLFYGQRDSLGLINWKETSQKFTAINETIGYYWDMALESGLALDSTKVSLTKEEKKNLKEYSKNNALSKQLYKAIEIKQLGWINCDIFYKISNKTNLQLDFNPKDSIVSAYAYLVFIETKSISQYPYFVSNNMTFNSGFIGIPVGAKTRLIVFSLKDGKLLSHRSDLTIGTNELINLKMNEIHKDSLVSLFNIN